VAALQASSGQDTPAVRVSLEQQQLRVRPERIEAGGQADVSVSLHAEGDDAEGIFVAFYDGDPESGELFDIERIAFIRAGDSYEARVGHRPHECGEHDIYAVVLSASNGLTEAKTTSTTGSGCRSARRLARHHEFDSRGDFGHGARGRDARRASLRRSVAQ
jgi:hypothetical protein